MKLVTILIFAQLIAGVRANFLVRKKTYHACKNKLADKNQEIAKRDQEIAEKDRKIADLSQKVKALVELNMSEDDELKEVLSNKPIEWDKPFDKHKPFVASKKEDPEMEPELEWDDEGIFSK